MVDVARRNGLVAVAYAYESVRQMKAAGIDDIWYVHHYATQTLPIFSRLALEISYINPLN